LMFEKVYERSVAPRLSTDKAVIPGFSSRYCANISNARKFIGIKGAAWKGLKSLFSNRFYSESTKCKSESQFKIVQQAKCF